MGSEMCIRDRLFVLVTIVSVNPVQAMDKRCMGEKLLLSRKKRRWAGQRSRCWGTTFIRKLTTILPARKCGRVVTTISRVAGVAATGNGAESTTMLARRLQHAPVGRPERYIARRLLQLFNLHLIGAERAEVGRTWRRYRKQT